MMPDSDSALPVYQGSIYSLLQRSGTGASSACFVLAVTSSHRGSGVTYLSRLLVDALNKDVPGCAICIDCGNFTQRSSMLDGRGTVLSRQAQTDLIPLDQGAWRSKPDLRAKYIRELRERFSYVLLDCRPISESSEVLGLTGLVDGVVSVVEANRTTKAQISYLERTLEQSGGNLLGHVLNKRTFPLPQWLHERLERVGI